MTEEEKKAIAYLKRHIIPYYGYKGRIEFMLNDILLNLIEKLQKENEELKNKVVKRDNDIIYLEETAEKEFITKQEVKENYISKGKIREVKQYLEYYLIGNLKYENCQNEFKKILKLLEEGKKLIDLMHCEIVYYYVCENDGYYWDGFVVIKCDDKYCVVEYKGSQSGWIKNQLESVDKEFLDNVIGDRKLDNIDDDFPSYFNTFLETTYNYPIPDAIMQQLKDQDAILLDFEDIKKHIKEERNAR